ncbi:hypothetical protein ABT160_32970 [Streptomyces sp. NPDC001941]|uniref:hypothetical protein n=1 Tax=Streptomyces sp. NPDC001941 TaxID=3154659 RepID=UPI00331CD666
MVKSYARHARESDEADSRRLRRILAIFALTCGVAPLAATINASQAAGLLPSRPAWTALSQSEPRTDSGLADQEATG